jgi:hypothetical protein
MKCPVKGRQPGHPATPAFRRERARRSPSHALLPWTTEQKRRSRPLLARGSRSLGRLARMGGALLRRTEAVGKSRPAVVLRWISTTVVGASPQGSARARATDSVGEPVRAARFGAFNTARDLSDSLDETEPAGQRLLKPLLSALSRSTVHCRLGRDAGAGHLSACGMCLADYAAGTAHGRACLRRKEFAQQDGTGQIASGPQRSGRALRRHLYAGGGTAPRSRSRASTGFPSPYWTRASCASASWQGPAGGTRST